MSRNVSFSLDTQAASVILTNMVAPVIKQKGEAIANRARGMAGSISSKPPEITVSTTVGTIKRGRRAIATVTAHAANERQSYIGRVALSKSKDAART